MHELSVCLALLEQVERIARERDASSVTAITLKIGPLSGIEADLLANAWPLASAGSLAERAELIIEAADIVVDCGKCGQRSTVPANRLLCTGCGNFQTRVVSGDEMILQRLELDLPQAAQVV